MRHVYTAELARLRWSVVNCRTGALLAAFTNCADACLMRDAGPRNSQGERLLEVIECVPKITKPRLRQRKRNEPRQRAPLCDLTEPLPPANFFQRSL